MERFIKIKRTAKDNLKNINKTILHFSIYFNNLNAGKSKYNNKLVNNNHSKILLLIIFIFYFFKPVATKKYLFFEKLDLASEISLIINGRGNQYILNNNTEEAYIQKPSKIIVNGIAQNYKDYIVYNLTKEQNSITIIFDKELTNCNSMFLNLTNITNIDLSKLNTSKLISMEKMFFGCSSLLSVNLKNINITSDINITGMFSYCKSLIYLDLRNFNISKEINLNNIFNGVNKDLIYCFDESKFNNYNYFYNNFNLNKCRCNDICFQNSGKIKFTENKTCTLSCTNNYKYEYNNICYNLCPNKTFISPFNNSKCAPKNCPNEYPYLNQNNECVENCLINNLFLFNKICLFYNLSDFENEFLVKAFLDYFNGRQLDELFNKEPNKSYIISNKEKNYLDEKGNEFIVKIEIYKNGLWNQNIEYK